MDKLFEGVASDTPELVTIGRKRLAVEGDTEMESGSSSSVLNTTIKLALAAALRTRVIASVVYRVFNFPVAEPIVQELIKATKKFSEMQKGLQNMGIPCIHAFMAMATFIAPSSTMKDQLSTSIANWSKEAAKMNRALWEFVHDQVKLFRLEKMFSSERRKLVTKIEGEARNVDAPVDSLTPKEMWEYPSALAHAELDEGASWSGSARGVRESLAQSYGQGEEVTDGRENTQSVVYVSKGSEKSIMVTASRTVDVVDSPSCEVAARVEAYMRSMRTASI